MNRLVAMFPPLLLACVSTASTNSSDYPRCALGLPTNRAITWAPLLAKHTRTSAKLCVDIPPDAVVVATYCRASYGWGDHPGTENCQLDKSCQDEARFSNHTDETKGDVRRVCVDFQNGKFRIDGSFLVQAYRP